MDNSCANQYCQHQPTHTPTLQRLDKPRHPQHPKGQKRQIALKRIPVHYKGWHHTKQQSSNQRQPAKPPCQKVHPQCSHQAEQPIGRMKGHLPHFPKQSQQTCQHKRIQRRMWMSRHRHHPSMKQIRCLMRMQRIRLRILRSSKVINVIALDGLREKGHTHSHHQGDDNQQVAKHFRRRRIWCNPQRSSCLRSSVQPDPSALP